MDINLNNTDKEKIQAMLDQCKDNDLNLIGTYEKVCNFARDYKIPKVINMIEFHYNDLSEEQDAVLLGYPAMLEFAKYKQNISGDLEKVHIRVTLNNTSIYKSISDLAKELEEEENESMTEEEYLDEKENLQQETEIIQDFEKEWELIKKKYPKFDLDQEDKTAWIASKQLESTMSESLKKLLAPRGFFKSLEMEEWWEKHSKAKHSGWDFEGIKNKEEYIKKVFPDINEIEKKQKGCTSVTDSLYQFQLKIIDFTKKIEEIDKQFEKNKSNEKLVKQYTHDKQKFEKAKEVTQRVHHYMKRVITRLDGTVEGLENLKIGVTSMLDEKSDPTALIKHLGWTDEQIKDQDYSVRREVKRLRKEMSSLRNDLPVLKEHRGYKEVALNLLTACLLLIPYLIAAAVKGNLTVFKVSTDSAKKADKLHQDIKKMEGPKQK